MADTAGPLVRDLNFVMVQTYSFIGDDRPKARYVLAAANRLFGAADARSIPSPVGLAHAYDLTHILARAINMAGTTERTAVRQALEQVSDYHGLIKHYARPFAPGRHDALSESDVIMTHYDADGAIVPFAHGRD